jgi:hypothetical protein
MEAIRAQLQKPLVLGIVAFVIGAIIGLVVLGWGLWPVKWVNANPAVLSPEYQQQWLRMAILEYAADGDTTKAQENYTALGDSAAKVMSDVVATPQNISSDQIQAFSQAVASVAQPPIKPAAKGAPIALILLLCLVLLLIVAALVWWFLLRNRFPKTGGEVATPAMQAEEAKRATTYTSYEAAPEGTPIAQFMASYKLGDDLFDDSFSIDSASGEFLGECGVGISETIGVGDPKKVTAFEVWLFDKNDIQTVTTVLMSGHAFEDSAIRQRLEAKGEPVQADLGVQPVLETQTLRLVARVVDMGYGDSSMPDKSFFEHMILELAIWPK